MRKRLRRIRKRIKNWLIYVAVKSGVKWLLTIQRDTAIKFMQRLSFLGYYLVKQERDKTIRHLKKIFGEHKSDLEIQDMAKGVFHNLGRNMADAFTIERFNAGNIDNYVQSTGLENLEHALSLGNGVIALTGHIGNWELMGAYLSMKGFPINVVGAPSYDPRLDELIIKNRKSSGMKYIARGSATRSIIRALKQNEVVGILIDQDTKKVEGVFAEFLGHPAYTPIGPVILAMKTSSAIVPMVIHIRKDGTHLIRVKPKLPLKIEGDDQNNLHHNIQLCNDALSEFILEHPTQWVWMHERWKTKPSDVKVS